MQAGLKGMIQKSQNLVSGKERWLILLLSHIVGKNTIFRKTWNKFLNLQKLIWGCLWKLDTFFFQNWCVIWNELPRTCYLLGIAVGRLFDGVALSLYLVSIQFVERLRAISKIHGLGNFWRGNNGQEWEGVISEWLSNHREEGVACHWSFSSVWRMYDAIHFVQQIGCRQPNPKLTKHTRK